MAYPAMGRAPSFQQYAPNIATPNGYGPPGQAGLQTILNHQDAYGQVAASTVGDEEYNRLLKNYKLAHERIEEQRLQMLAQEKQNALLRQHISLLEGSEASSPSVVGSHVGGGGGSTVDDFTIKNSSSGLERRINRWSADTLAAHTRNAPLPPPGVVLPRHLPLIPLAEAIFADLGDDARDSPFLSALRGVGFDYPGLGLVVQSLLRHTMSVLLTEGIVNELLVTNSEEANSELTKLHTNLFNREPLVASVWRRQTFSAAVDALDPAIAISLFAVHMPTLFALVNPDPQVLLPPLAAVLDASYTFSRMLHASKTLTGGGGAEGSGFYRAFVPEIGSQLDPAQLELIKRCYRTERGEPERVGACLFPGLVKVSAADSAPVPPAVHLSLGAAGLEPPATTKPRETRTLIVRRAQVICECALAAAPGLARQ